MLSLQHKIQNFIENGELRITSNIEVISLGENTMEIKGLLYPAELESLHKVIAGITYLEGVPTAPLIIRGTVN